MIRQGLPDPYQVQTLVETLKSCGNVLLTQTKNHPENNFVENYIASKSSVLLAHNIRWSSTFERSGLQYEGFGVLSAADQPNKIIPRLIMLFRRTSQKFAYHDLHRADKQALATAPTG